MLNLFINVNKMLSLVEFSHIISEISVGIVVGVVFWEMN